MSKENTAVTKKKIKRCKEDVVFDAACFIILTLVLFVVAYPLYWVIISSISAPSAVSSGKVLLHPIGFTLKGYAEVFKNDQVMRGFLNSLIITFCGVMVNLIVTLPTSYALSRSNFSGKKPITIFYLITMFFGGGLIPTYLVMKTLGLTNTLWVVILLPAINVYNLVLMRNFFEGIPASLFESAEIDGCSPMGTFFKIVLPLSKAALTAIGLMFAVQYWNDYTNYKLYITNENLYNFQMKLRSLILGSDLPSAVGSATENTIKNAAVIVAILPFVIIYPFCQKYFISGVNIGAVKE